MLFQTGTFLLFFLVFFHVYWWLNRGKRPRWLVHVLILAGSYFFYGFWDARLLGLIVFSSLVDYFCGLQLASSTEPGGRKRMLWLSVLVNLGMLAVFKYFNFFGESLAGVVQLFGGELSWTSRHIVLPVGISFYTFQSMSYTIDVYRGRISAERNILVFLSYVAFFPQLVAGPIERASHLIPQFKQRAIFSTAQTVSGLRLVLYGLFQKLVIADNLGKIVDACLASGDFKVAKVLLISSVFAGQILADFAGYSNLAIGLARMLGFELRANFRSPYFSSSLGEFWQRWHISLSQWFRDYVYVPLGGNRNGRLRNSLNIFLVFVLSGLWHGAAWTFVIWGALHGSLLVLERYFLKVTVPIWLKTALTFLVVALLWLPFRAHDFEQLTALASGLLKWKASNWPTFAFSTVQFVLLTGATLLWISIDRRLKEQDISELFSGFTTSVRWGYYTIFVLLLLLLMPLDSAPVFIYFQF